MGITQKEITVQKAREILGKSADSMSDEQIQNLLAKIDFLIKNWMKSYERTVFSGKTLKDVIDALGQQ